MRVPIERAPARELLAILGPTPPWQGERTVAHGPQVRGTSRGTNRREPQLTRESLHRLNARDTACLTVPEASHNPEVSGSNPAPAIGRSPPLEWDYRRGAGGRGCRHANLHVRMEVRPALRRIGPERGTAGRRGNQGSAFAVSFRSLLGGDDGPNSSGRRWHIPLAARD
jgi:hypothetical protein